MKVLEPSAGRGAIIAGVVICGAISRSDITAYEIDPKNALFLEESGVNTTCGDFLKQEAQPIFDCVVMNPPFAKQVDIHHVLHAFKFLRPGGRLVSVMSAGVEFRTNRLTTEFRQFVEDHGGLIERLPDGSFLESGTGVNTVIVTLEA
jgi:predicted RNA methylase